MIRIRDRLLSFILKTREAAYLREDGAVVVTLDRRKVTEYLDSTVEFT